MGATHLSSFLQRQVQQVLVREKARHDGVIVAADHPRNVLRGLAASELNGIRVKVQSVPSQAVKTLENVLKVYQYSYGEVCKWRAKVE